MFRSLMVLGIAALVAPAVQDPAAAKPPEDEYKERVAKIKDNLAEEHFKVGEYLNGMSMFRWGRDEYRKAIGFSANHKEARQRLGYMIKDGEWEPDPNAAVEAENKKTGNEADKVRAEYDKKVQKLGQAIAKQWSDLGGWCEKNKLKAESEAAWKLAIEYDPLNSDSRKKLGYTKQKDGPWLSKFEVAFRKSIKDGLAKAPSGAPHKEETTVEKDLGWKNTKRSSAHFIVEVMGKDQDWLKEEVKYGEHAFAMFHKLFDLKEDLWQQKYNPVFVKGQAEHEMYIDKYHPGDAAKKQFAKKSAGLNGFPTAERILGEGADVHDHMVHHTAELCLEHMVGGRRIWLQEGMAYHFTVLFLGTSDTACVNMGGTGSDGVKRDYRKAVDWPIILRQLVKEGKDPLMLEVFKCKDAAEFDGAEAVKAWSMVNFLATEHRERFMEFLSKIRGQKEDEDEKALLEVFGWTIEDFDVRWKAYIRAS
ncbi:MAG TPA: hypothetical protein VFC86_02860 [Planctomycetota bacterium]|nr:hypothetical protein [Planctomycetota bacterium]